MRRFASEAREAGVDIKTIEVPFGEHGFDITGIGNSIARNATLRFINDHDSKKTSSSSLQAEPTR